MRSIRFAAIFCVALLVLLSVVYWNNTKFGERSNLTIVCLGDSITYGYKLSNPVIESYPARLQKQVREGWQVLNLGVNGATVLNKGDIPTITQGAYQHSMKSMPDVVVLMLGTNDTKDINWQYNGEFVSDYVALVNEMQDLPSHPHVIVCSIPPIFADYPNGINAKREEGINDLLKSVVADSDADFLDLYAVLSHEPSFFIDGVHPNARGAQEIATLVFNKVTNL